MTDSFWCPAYLGAGRISDPLSNEISKSLCLNLNFISEFDENDSVRDQKILDTAQNRTWMSVFNLFGMLLALLSYVGLTAVFYINIIWVPGNAYQNMPGLTRKMDVTRVLIIFHLKALLTSPMATTEG